MMSDLIQHEEIFGKSYQKLYDGAAKLMRNKEKSLVLWGPSGIGKTLLLKFLLKEACNKRLGLVAHLEIMPTRKTALKGILSQLGGEVAKGDAADLAARIRSVIRTSEKPVYLFLDQVCHLNPIHFF